MSDRPTPPASVLGQHLTLQSTLDDISEATTEAHNNLTGALTDLESLTGQLVILRDQVPSEDTKVTIGAIQRTADSAKTNAQHADAGLRDAIFVLSTLTSPPPIAVDPPPSVGNMPHSRPELAPVRPKGAVKRD